MNTDKGRPFMGIKEIRIKNFRSLRGVAISLEPLTLFVGPNGSGKSNILRSLSFVRRALRVPPIFLRRSLRPEVWRSGDGRLATSVGIGVKLALQDVNGGPVDADYAFEYEMADQTVRVRRERCLVRGEGVLFFDRVEQTLQHNLGFDVPELKPDALALPLLSRIGTFGSVHDALSDARLYSIDPDSIREIPTAEPPFTPILRSNGSNLVEVLAYLQENDPDILDRISDHLSAVVPGTKVLLQARDQRVHLRFSQDTELGQLQLTANHLSDGTLRVLGMLTAVYQRPVPFVIALEEPESTIHPAALPVLLDILAAGSETGQMLVTTHSPDVLEWPDIPLDAVKLVEWTDGETNISPVGHAARSMLLDNRMTLGEMMRSNALLPDPVEPSVEVDLFPELM